MIAHKWPGITPLSVWELEVETWCLFATAADHVVEEAERAARQRGAS